MGADPFGLVGQVLDALYRVDEVAGEGGFSVVYKGYHVGLGEPIAIKCLKLQASYGSAVVESFMNRFRDEGKILYRLSQGNLHIVRSIAAGIALAPATSGLVPYTVLEWLDGRSLADDFEWRRSGGMTGRSLGEAIDLLDSVADAVAHAHQLGVVHRDLNPGNIFLANTREGVRAKVLDFGVAKVVSDHAMALGPRAATYGQMRIFSPAYGAPEQYEVTLGKITPQTDVYTLALVLVEALRDAPTNAGVDLSSMIERTLDPLHRPTPRAFGIELGDAVEDVFARALAVRPEQRPRDAGELWTQLKRASRVRPHLPAPPPPSRDTERMKPSDLPRPAPPSAQVAARLPAPPSAPTAAANVPAPPSAPIPSAPPVTHVAQLVTDGDPYRPASTLRMGPEDHFRAQTDRVAPGPEPDADATVPRAPPRPGKELPSQPAFGPVPTLWEPVGAPRAPMPSQPQPQALGAPPSTTIETGAFSQPSSPQLGVAPKRSSAGIVVAAIFGALLAIVGLGVVARSLHLLPASLGGLPNPVASGDSNARPATTDDPNGTSTAAAPSTPATTEPPTGVISATTATSPPAVTPAATPPTSQRPAPVDTAPLDTATTPGRGGPGGTSTSPASTIVRPTAPTPVDPLAFNPALAESRLHAVDGILASCRKPEGKGGLGVVHVVFANDGSVSTAHVGPPFVGTPEGACTEARFGVVRIPPFQGAPGVVDHRFRLPK